MAVPKMTGMTIDDKKYINILLLGETGVGKSTFINSFANYLQYPSMSDASVSKLICLIPAKFTVTTDDNEQKLVTFGQDENEDKELGNSSTQKTRAYVFQLDTERWVRLIDTPGIGDSRGVEQDRLNLENILEYIGEFEHLHAICFLLKPTVTVINPYFKSCIMELLSRLDRSASKNIIFLFTNTRGSDYKAVDTMTNMQRILTDLEAKEKVTIPLNYSSNATNNNVFCFDNEGFKYLVALQKDIHYGNRNTMQKSWDISCLASWALIDYIAGDKDRKPLTPHKVQNTVSINEARRLIITLSKPLADINDLIQDNLVALERHKEKVLQENLSTEELKKVLCIPVIDIKQTTLQRPTTVCTAMRCSEIHTLLGIKKYHYKQRCHNPCYLTNVPKEIIGSPELMHCAAMSGRQCKVCLCDFSSHMHIYYETEAFPTTMEDNSVKLQINSNAEKVAAQFKCIKQLEEQSTAYQNDYQIISKSMAKFAYFLKHNSICPINDAYEEYLEYLIRRESFSGGDQELCRRYKSLKKEHLEQKYLLEQATKMSHDVGITHVSAEEVINSVKDLYKLKKIGQRIKDLHLRQGIGTQRELKSNMEYTHDMIAKKPGTGSKATSSKKQKKKNVDRKQLIADLLDNNNLEEAMNHIKKLIEEKNNAEKTSEEELTMDNLLKTFTEMMKTNQSTTFNKGQKKNKQNANFKQQQNCGNQQRNHGHNTRQFNNSSRQQFHQNNPRQQFHQNNPGQQFHPRQQFQNNQRPPFFNNNPRPQQFNNLQWRNPMHQPPSPQVPNWNNPQASGWQGPGNVGFPPMQMPPMFNQPNVQPSSQPINVTVNLPATTSSDNQQQEKKNQHTLSSVFDLPPPPSYEHAVNSRSSNQHNNRGGMHHNNRGYHNQNNRGGRTAGNQKQFKKASSRKQQHSQQVDDDNDSDSSSDMSNASSQPPPREEKKKAMTEFERMQEYLEDQRRILRQNQGVDNATSIPNEERQTPPRRNDDPVKNMLLKFLKKF